MKLFDAIRQLKEGQKILGEDGKTLMSWRNGDSSPWYWAITDSDFLRTVRIIDMPKPPISLEEGLKRFFGDCLVVDWLTEALRSEDYNIDFQEEVDRQRRGRINENNK